MNEAAPNTGDVRKSATLITDAQGRVRGGIGSFAELLGHRLPPIEPIKIDKHVNDLFPAPLAAELMRLIQTAQYAHGTVVAEIPTESDATATTTCRAFVLPTLWADDHLILLQLESVTEQEWGVTHDPHRLFSSTRHDVNNPLTSIIGFSELLKLEDQPHKRDRYANLIASEADRCRRALEKAEYFALQPKPTFRQVNLNDIVRSVVDSREIPLELEGITLETSLDSSIGPLHADLQQIELAIYSLLLNAEQSLLGKTADKRIQIRTVRRPNAVIMEIQDNGKGILPEDLERVFRPFQSSKQRGSGLGLAIAKRIITNHGGDIELESTQHVGTIARIALKPRTEETPRKAMTTPASIRNKRILVVEPRQDIVDLYQELLSDVGAMAFGATTVQTAVGVLEEEPIDVVLVDESVPTRDAKRIAAAVSLQPKPISTVFVGMVGNINDPSSIQWLRDWGASGSEKPLSVVSLSQFLGSQVAGVSR